MADEVKMTKEALTCPWHAGMECDVRNIREDHKKDFEKLEIVVNQQRNRIDAIVTRLNITIGGVAISCILLAINMMLQ